MAEKKPLQKEASGKRRKSSSAMAKEIVDSVKSLIKAGWRSIRRVIMAPAENSGFAARYRKLSVGMSVIDYGNYLNRIDTAIAESNAQMMRAVLTSRGDQPECQSAWFYRGAVPCKYIQYAGGP